MTHDPSNDCPLLTRKEFTDLWYCLAQWYSQGKGGTPEDCLKAAQSVDIVLNDALSRVMHEAEERGIKKGQQDGFKQGMIQPDKVPVGFALVPVSDSVEKHIHNLETSESKLARKNHALTEAIGFMANKNSGLRHKIDRNRSFIAKLKAEHQEQIADLQAEIERLDVENNFLAEKLEAKKPEATVAVDMETFNLTEWLKGATNCSVEDNDVARHAPSRGTQQERFVLFKREIDQIVAAVKELSKPAVTEPIAIPVEIAAPEPKKQGEASMGLGNGIVAHGDSRSIDYLYQIAMEHGDIVQELKNFHTGGEATNGLLAKVRALHQFWQNDNFRSEQVARELFGPDIWSSFDKMFANLDKVMR